MTGPKISSREIRACGGDMMVRVAAFQTAGGFDPWLVVSEDEEFCLRLVQRTGLRVYRIPRVMTHHDIHMSQFRQWWRRTHQDQRAHEDGP